MVCTVSAPLLTLTVTPLAGLPPGLAVTTPNRLPNLPAVPTMGESVPGYVFESWIGLVAPAATPAAVTARLHEALESALRDKDIETRFNALGAQALPESSGKFGERIASAGFELSWAQRTTFAGYQRFHCWDGFGNRVEVMTPTE